MDVTVCVGSSCHLKGASQVVEKFQEIIEGTPGSQIILGASFCQNRCKEGVIVSIDGKIYTKVRPDDVPGLVEKHLEGGH